MQLRQLLSNPTGALPPTLLIRSARWVWTTMWQAMMAQLAPSSSAGDYERPSSQFREWVSSEADATFPAAPDRYQLIVGMGCPWAHRTLVVRSLKGLDAAISVARVVPSPDSGIWVFASPLAGCHTLPEFYALAQPGYQGRCTVPVLWDRQTQQIVNNESADIIVMLNAAFQAWAMQPDLDLYPESLRSRIDAWNERIYHTVNNGVYRCGFAQSQAAYERACTALFATLDAVDAVLATQRYLGGDRVTLADVRLFTTLVRFDLVYYSLFKCNQQRIQDYPHLGPYLRDLYQLPGVAATCDLDQIKQEYYGNLFPLNPGGIMPLGPRLDLTQPHDRDRADFTAVNPV